MLVRPEDGGAKLAFDAVGVAVTVAGAGVVLAVVAVVVAAADIVEELEPVDLRNSDLDSHNSLLVSLGCNLAQLTQEWED